MLKNKKNGFDRSVDRAVDSFRAYQLLRVDGRAPADVWNAISGFYRTADERFIQLHTNFPHHLERTLQVLGAAGALVAMMERMAAYHFEFEGRGVSRQAMVETMAHIVHQTVTGRRA